MGLRGRLWSEERSLIYGQLMSILFDNDEQSSKLEKELDTKVKRLAISYSSTEFTAVFIGHYSGCEAMMLYNYT